MPSIPSAGHLSGVIAAVCDAVRAFATEDDADVALARVREALAGLGRSLGESQPRMEEEDPLLGMLAAIKDLARAQELLATSDPGRAEPDMDTAADRLAAAAHAIEHMQPDGSGSETASIQFSVSEALRIPNEEAIATALENLLDRSESEAFVIFVDAHSGNFVQFIGSKSGPLFLDLPFTSLDEPEAARARVFFEKNGFVDVEGEEGFSVGVGRNVRAGTDLALGIFKHVYRADPDFSLKIEEN